MLDDYRLALERAQKSAGTIAKRLDDIQRFQQTHPDLLAVTTNQLEQYVNTKLAAEYRRALTSSFRAFYRWAHANNLIVVDPAAALPGVKIPRRVARPAIPDSVVLPAFENGTLHERAIIALASTEGLRRSEIAALHPSQRAGKHIRVTGKGDKQRRLPLDDVTHQLLLELEREQGRESYYFPGRSGGHLHPATVYKWAKRHIGDWSLHSLRRRAATKGYAAEKDIFALREFLGHASIDTSIHYIEVHEDALTAMVGAATLGKFPTVRRIAGIPTEERPQLDERAAFLAEFTILAGRAKALGLELTLK